MRPMSCYIKAYHDNWRVRFSSKERYYDAIKIKRLTM